MVRETEVDFLAGLDAFLGEAVLTADLSFNEDVTLTGDGSLTGDGTLTGDGVFTGDTFFSGDGFFTGDTLTLGVDSVFLADSFFSDLVGDSVFLIGETDFFETDLLEYDFSADDLSLAADFFSTVTTSSEILTI